MHEKNYGEPIIDYIEETLRERERLVGKLRFWQIANNSSNLSDLSTFNCLHYVVSYNGIIISMSSR